MAEGDHGLPPSYEELVAENKRMREALDSAHKWLLAPSGFEEAEVARKIIAAALEPRSSRSHT